MAGADLPTDHVPKPADEVEIPTFEQVFDVFGGRSSFDQLRQFSKESALHVQQLRDNAQNVQQATIDSRLVFLRGILASTKPLEKDNPAAKDSQTVEG